MFEERDVSFDYGEGKYVGHVMPGFITSHSLGAEEGLLRGVEMAIGQMKTEESSRVVISSKYGFGEAGDAEKGIPGGATLVYYIRLNSFEKVSSPSLPPSVLLTCSLSLLPLAFNFMCFYELPCILDHHRWSILIHVLHAIFLLQPKAAWEYNDVEERKTDAEKLKERGTNYFKEGKWELAQKLYERGSELISNSQLSKDEEKEAVKILRIALHLNQAACHLKLNEPSLALKECEEVYHSFPESQNYF